MNSRIPPGADPRRVPLTTEMIAALRAQRERTGVSVPKLVRNHLDPERGITERLIQCWMLSALRSIHPESYAHVLDTWKAIPDCDRDYVPYSPSIRAAMAAEVKRAGIGIPSFVAGLTDTPEGLTANKINNFYYGKLHRLPRRYADYIMRQLRALPGRTSEAVPLTPEILETLRAQAGRTGKSSYSLLSGARDMPDGLQAAIIQSWLFDKTRSARKDHLDYVLHRYEAAAASQRIEITPALLEELHAESSRTGIGPHALLSDARDKPGKLNGNTIQNWMRGNSRTARKDHLDYVLARWRALPEVDSRPPYKKPTASQRRNAALQHRPLKLPRSPSGGQDS